jgi:hypothetical protein
MTTTISVATRSGTGFDTKAARSSATSAIRIRLGSTVVRVQHQESRQHANAVRIAHLHDDTVHGVRAANAILVRQRDDSVLM